jgi:hypothetical protein
MKLLRFLHYCCLFLAASLIASLVLIPRAEWLPFLILASAASALPLLGQALIAKYTHVQLRSRYREIEKGALTDPLPTQWDDLASLTQKLSDLQQDLCKTRGLPFGFSMALLIGSCSGILAHQALPPSLPRLSAQQISLPNSPGNSPHPALQPPPREFGPKRGNQNLESAQHQATSELAPMPTGVPPTEQTFELHAPPLASHTPSSEGSEIPAATPTRKPRLLRRPSPSPNSAEIITPAPPTAAVISGPFTSNLK